MKTTVNGVEITSNISEVLREWNENTGTSVSTPERYVSYLSDIQDFLCYLLDDPDDCRNIKQLLLHIIYIKDDLKRFIRMEGGES
jgi:hypothetical protein